MLQCPLNTTREHTDQFKKVYETLYDELKKRNITGVDDTEELAKALAVLVADSIEMNIYK
jgi:hypothetical protein